MSYDGMGRYFRLAPDLQKGSVGCLDGLRSRQGAVLALAGKLE
jgi:hypothetical protein